VLSVTSAVNSTAPAADAEAANKLINNPRTSATDIQNVLYVNAEEEEEEERGKEINSATDRSCVIKQMADDEHYGFVDYVI
jgi:hypothetical protein